MHEHQKYRYLITSLAAIAATAVTAVSTDAAFVANAHATTIQAQERTVSYRDLDITRSPDRAILDRRVRRAVRSVCDAGLWPPMTGATRTCMRRTQADADLQIARHVGAALERQAALQPGKTTRMNP